MNTALIRNTLLLRQLHLQQQLVNTELNMQQPITIGSQALKLYGVDHMEQVANKIAAELLQVKQVLKKMGYRSYGFCQRCGEAIDEERLAIQSCTPLCRSCATEH